MQPELFEAPVSINVSCPWCKSSTTIHFPTVMLTTDILEHSGYNIYDCEWCHREMYINVHLDAIPYRSHRADNLARIYGPQPAQKENIESKMKKYINNFLKNGRKI